MIYGNAVQYIAAPHLTESVSRQVNRNAQNSAEPAFHMLTLNFWWVSGRSAIFLPSAGIGLVQVEETQLDPVSQPDSMSTEAEH